MPRLDLAAARWRKSSYSSGGDDGACVEVAFVGPAVAIRDSKNPAQPPLVVSTADWRALLAAIRR